MFCCSLVLVSILCGADHPIQRAADGANDVPSSATDAAATSAASMKQPQSVRNHVQHTSADGPAEPVPVPASAENVQRPAAPSDCPPIVLRSVSEPTVRVQFSAMHMIEVQKFSECN